MQPVTVQEQIEYASLGWRFTAVLIDTVVLVCIWTVMLLVDMVVLMGQSSLNASDPAAAQALSREITQKIIDQQLGNSNLLFYVIVFGSLFIYYLLLEAFFAASVGKLVCRMRVTMVDGSRPTGVALVVRNLVRVPEAMFFYIPSGISCSASPRRERLGDYAAHTVVVRRRLVPAGGAVRPAPGAPPYGAPASGPACVRRAGRARAGRAAGPERAARTAGGSRSGRPPASGGRARAAQDGSAGRARRAPQLPALLGTRTCGRRRRPLEGLLGRVRERLVHAHGLGGGAAQRARRCRRLRSGRGAHRSKTPARRSPTLRTCCASWSRTSPPTATTASTRRSWPSPARTLPAPDAAMGGALRAPPTHQGGF